MDRGAWWATVHGVAKSWTRLSVFLPAASALDSSSSFFQVVPVYAVDLNLILLHIFCNPSFFSPLPLDKPLGGIPVTTGNQAGS